MQTTAARTKESMSPGPAYSAATMPVSTKIPVPIMTPRPISVMSTALSVLRKDRSTPALSISRSKECRFLVLKMFTVRLPLYCNMFNSKSYDLQNQV